jgi:amino acid adenylation domain-containing protein
MNDENQHFSDAGLVSRNNGAIHQMFEVQAQNTPHGIAVTLGDERLTYRELNARANKLAHYLRKRGIGRGSFVGLCLDRTLDLVVGLLGILKAGGAYVPIDPQYPRERLSFMLQDSRSSLMLTQHSLAAELAIAGTPSVLLDVAWAEISLESESNLADEAAPEDLAYVIYTSGSTGTPKGTLITHHNVVRLFQSTQAWFNFSRDDVWTLFHSCAFDFSVWEIWGALLHGGRLVVVPFATTRTPEDFYRLLGDEGVTVLNQTPSAFRQLIRVEDALGARSTLALRYVIFGGEALDMSTLKPWFDRHGDRQPQLVNMYGITETTVHVTYRPIGAADLHSGSVIGVPIPDLQIHLLDDQGVPVPAGATGEIYIGGAGVARGYLNRAELTAQRFVPDHVGSDPSRRLYRSGDLARFLANGDLEYLGRIDSQVKIRGFRIELGEISAVIKSHHAIRDSVVVARDTAAGEKILVGYLIKDPQQHVTLAEVRRTLRDHLPEYMVPSAFVFIERLPLTVNGKLDVKALPAPPAEVEVDVRTAHKGSSLEESIAEVWRAVLGLPAVGFSDNFFDVGCNSVHLANVHDQLQKRLGRSFSITDLFAYPTIGALASHFTGDVKNDHASANRLRAQRQREALLAQRNMRRERK